LVSIESLLVLLSSLPMLFILEGLLPLRGGRWGAVSFPATTAAPVSRARWEFASMEADSKLDLR
jgi:hypothetical protein